VATDLLADLAGDRAQDVPGEVAVVVVDPLTGRAIIGQSASARATRGLERIPPIPLGLEV
jgi:hypothetical protein